MAIYHLTGTIISRSQGRSAVASAAYRAGENLYDELYQKRQNYSYRKDVVFRGIITPEQAPQWMQDRAQLWNSIEAQENRKDAQLAREFNFSLPVELSLVQNIELAKKFVQEAFVDRGMVADLAIHEDRKDQISYLHAHVMLSMRQIDGGQFGGKVRSWNSKELLLKWREDWANICNQYLALNDHDLTIDHRTLAAQKIALEPQHQIGPKQIPEYVTKATDHLRIARENGERLLQKPQIALQAITQQQSTFTNRDLARFVHRHTADVEQFDRLYSLIKTQKNIIKLGLDHNKIARFTTQEMLKLESYMLTSAKSLWHNRDELVIPMVTRRKVLEQYKLIGEQKNVGDYLLRDGNLKCVVGYAGTGKSYLLKAAKAAWEATGYRVQGVTLAGIAAESLEGGSGIVSRTLASRLYYWDKGLEGLTAKDVLVVDEAGMLGSKQLARIIEEVSKAKAKLILVGDPQQLQAIEAGAAFRAITQVVGYRELTQIFRQTVEWQKTVVKELAIGNTENALDLLERHAHVHMSVTNELAKWQMVNLWNDVRLQNAGISQIMLAYKKVDVYDLNQRARLLRQEHGELGREYSFTTFTGDRIFAENDRVYFLKNDRDLGVMNGSLGTIKTIENKGITVVLDPTTNTKSKNIVVDFALYNHLDHGYAATIHKCQGVTVDRSYLLASKNLDAHATYVGLSRHRESVDLFYSKEDFPSYFNLTSTLARDAAKDVSIDYLTDFRLNRAIQTRAPQQVKKTEQNLQHQGFPFKKQYSNLAGYVQENQTFAALRAQLQQKFAKYEHEALEQLLHKDLASDNNLEQQLTAIRAENRRIAQQLKQHQVKIKYSAVEPNEVIRGIIGRRIELLSGQRMLELRQGDGLPTKLIPEVALLIKQRGQQVELTFNEQGQLVRLKDAKELIAESLRQQQQQLAAQKIQDKTPKINKQLSLSKDFGRGL